ncbi:MAG: DUF423 domain-containing protein [Myxococcales bacterium]|nr:DUF423 domain-containing protein [Myxococcales bacterium]
MTQRNTFICAGTLGLLAVAAGAFGAHALRGRLDPAQLEWWATAARYQLIHAVALLIVAWGAGPWSRIRAAAAWGFTVGVLLFSGTLYAMALGGPRILGAVTPLGGLAMMIGWLLVVIHGARSAAATDQK